MPTRCSVTHLCFKATVLLLAVAGVSYPVAAQSLNDFRLPPGRPSPGPAPVGPQTDELPARRPAETPNAAPALAPSATTLRPTMIVPDAPPERSTAKPGGMPRARPSPASPTPTPAAAATSASFPARASASPPMTPAASEAPDYPLTGPRRPSTAERSAGLASAPPREVPFWLWLIAVAGTSAMLGLTLWRSWAGRKQDRPDTPVDATPALTAAPARSAAPALAPLILSFEPDRLSLSLLNASLRYRLSATNRTDTPLALAIALDMIAAHASLPEDEQLTTAWDSAQTIHREPALAPGAATSWNGEMQLRLDQIRPIRHGTATLFVPLVRMTVDTGGEILRYAFVIGEPPTSGSRGLAPVQLDLGPRIIPEMAARALAVPA